MTHQLQTKLWREGGLLSDAVDCHIYIYCIDSCWWLFLRDTTISPKFVSLIVFN